MEFHPDNRDWVKLDKFRRYQNALSVHNLFPNLKNGLCGCGCNSPLSKGRSRWSTNDCQERAIELFWIIKGDIPKIRKALLKRDLGACRHCGLISDTWQADHIIPVHKGGGACGLDNYQTLCVECHKQKTKLDLKK